MKLIINMQMPNNCSECPLAQFDYGRFCGWVVHCKNGMKSVEREIADNGRPDWCPIVSVLPDEHGDLIDRQDAIKEFEPYAEYESNRRNADWVKRIKAVLNAMTPVIAAERKNNGNNP